MNHTESDLRPRRSIAMAEASRSMLRPLSAGSQPSPIATRRSGGAPVLVSDTVCRLASDTLPLSRLILPPAAAGSGTGGAARVAASAGASSATEMPKFVAIPASPSA